MAEGIGVDGLHCISGMCDLCGEACDANSQELNVLSCTFKNCEDLPYHQDCLEKYLKSIRLERNRKTGFKCPRGCGKGTKHPGPCPGKIDKSHPIHPRNEEQKKKKKANLPQIMAAAPQRVIKTKQEKKAEKEQTKAAAAAAAAAAEKAKAAKAAAAVRPAATSSSAAAASSSKAKQQPQPDAKKLAEAAAALRREIAANKTKQQEHPQQQRDASPSQPEYKTLDAYLRENSASSSSTAAAAAAAAAPVVNAWAKPPAPAPHSQSGAQQQQRHQPAVVTRLPAAAATVARDVSPVSPAAAAATTPRVPQAGPGRPAAAGAGLPPMPQPPPPPPPPPAAAAQQAHGMHHVPSIHSHPLASQGSTMSLTSQASAGANGSLPVGAEYVGDDSQLTKAQRKNLKRAEKKKQKETGMPPAAAGGAGPSSAAAAAAASASPRTGTKLSRLAIATGGFSGAPSAGGSISLSRHASSTSDSLAAVAAAAATAAPSASSAAAAAEPEDEESVALMYELAVHALLAKKTLALVASLQRLGFAEWQAAAAVQRHGSDLEDAVAWLLEGGAPDPEAAAAVSAGCVADVSIAAELRLMEALGAALPQLPRSQLYIAVANAGGDLDKAAAAAVQQQTEIVAAAEAALAAAAAGNSPLTSVSISASPTSTTSAQQQQQQQRQHAQVQQQEQQQQQQQLPNGLGSVDSPQYSAFGGPSLSLYGASAAPNALAPAAPSALPSVAEGSEVLGSVPDTSFSSGFASWFNPATSMEGSGLGTNLGGSGLTAHPLHSLASSSSLGMGPLESTGSGFGSYLPGSATAVAAAAMGSNIWGAGSVDAASSSAGWGHLAAASSAQLQQPGEALQGGSGSLFANSGLDAGLGGWGSLGLGGHSGLGLLGNQGGMVTAEPALNPYAPFGSGGGSGLFAAGAMLGQQGQQRALASTPAVGDAGLQQSRLFSSYGVSQPSLFGSGVQPQQQQQQAGAGWGVAAGAAGGAMPETAASADDDDLEGMLATLMCH